MQAFITSSEYCMPVLGVIFLRHATNRYDDAARRIEAGQAAGTMPKRPLVKGDFLKTLQTHLINDMDAYVVKADDYDTFIARRARAIALALNVKLMSMTPAQAAAAEKERAGRLRYEWRTEEGGHHRPSEGSSTCGRRSKPTY